MIYIKILLPLLLALPSLAAEIHRLPPESRTDFSFTFGKDTSVEFKTGKGKEGFAFFKVGDNDISCRFMDANGKSKNIPYRTNGLARRNFAWNDNLLGWSSIYEKMFAKDLSVYPQAVTLENRNGETVVFLNGVALNAVPAIETIVLPEKRNVSWKWTVPLKESGFRMIDIGQRFNASGDLKISENKEINVAGVPFLKKNDEASRLFHGIAVDIGYFERLPEQQMHQCSLHRMYMVNYYWKKFRKDAPLHVTFEGPCIAPVLPGALTEREFAAHVMRQA